MTIATFETATNSTRPKDPKKRPTKPRYGPKANRNPQPRSGKIYFTDVNLDVGNIRVKFKAAASTVPKSWLHAAIMKLEQVKQLGTNWNSYGAEPPSTFAVFWAERALTVLHALNFPPAKLAPSAEGGGRYRFRRR